MPSHHPDQRIVSVKPITVPAPGRSADLPVKVTAPLADQNLPVIVFSHGNAWSLDGYQPLVDRWAAAGFVVVQPTHLDSRRNGIGWDDPRFATIWRVRIADLHAVLDGLGDVLLQAGGLETRVDRERIAIVGHSWGAQTAGALLGARVLDADGTPGEDFSHPAVSAGALIAATGTGDTLTPFAAEHLPFMRPDYSTMTTPALVIAGGRDQSQLSTRGPDWFTDAYHLSPSPKSLLAIAEGEHTLGGIAGERAAETTDEDPAPRRPRRRRDLRLPPRRLRARRRRVDRLRQRRRSRRRHVEHLQQVNPAGTAMFRLASAATSVVRTGLGPVSMKCSRSRERAVVYVRLHFWVVTPGRAKEATR